MAQKRLRMLVPAVLTVLLAACGAGGGSSGSAAAAAPSGVPQLKVDVLADGLDHPWDVVQAPDGTLLVSERSGHLTAVRSGGARQKVAADLRDLFAEGETGLMGLALDPAFGKNRRFYSCQGVTDGAHGPEIQVIAWRVAPDWTAATRTDDPLVGGIPVNQAVGRHGGCRLLFGADGALYIGTGDNALGTNPQNLRSMAGKVLRVDRVTGQGLPDNPFAGSQDPATRRIYTYGHRNVQGLALRPGTRQLYSIEHGPDRDDEVNLLRPGANYGWDPTDGKTGYNEKVPMTDHSIRGAVPAVWSSGSPTIAPSGATFVSGRAWGSYGGALFIALLKDTGVLALRLDAHGALVDQFRIPELEIDHGRIRTVRQGRDGALYLTTDNGGGSDVLLRVTPRA